MDYYVVIILVPKGGHRIVLNGVQAEIEVKHDYIQATKTGTGYKNVKSKPGASYLDILLTVPNTNIEQFKKVKSKITGNELFLHFKDAHPALIKGYVKDIITDQFKTEINFTGNTTDKSYYDYITETTTQLNTQQLICNKSNEEEYDILTSPNDPIDDGIVEPNPIADPGFKKKVHFNKQKKRKDKVLKRKLTF